MNETYKVKETGTGANKILAVEEMQSDFATAVRKQEMDYPAFDPETQSAAGEWINGEFVPFTN